MEKGLDYRYKEFRRAIAEANEAKDRLYGIYRKLEELGFHRKAQSCWNLIGKIEAWQHTKP